MLRSEYLVNNVWKIESAKPEHAPGIVTVQYRAWLTTYPNFVCGITPEDVIYKFGDIQKKIEKRAQFLTAIQTATNKTYRVATENNNIIGFIYGHKGNPYHYLESLYVDPDHQHKGVGTGLFQDLLIWLGNDAEIELSVVSYNSKAIAFYKKMGFVVEGPIATQFGKLPLGKTMLELQMIRKNIIL